MAIEPVTREERFLAAAGGQSVTPPAPITRKEQLLQGIIDAVKSGGATPDVIEGAVNDYLNANPVQPGATTEQAAQIEQNKNDIADLQVEIEKKQPKGDYVKTVNGNKPDATGNVVVATGGNGSGQNAAFPASAKTILGNIVTILKAQVEDELGTPQGYNIDVSGLFDQCDALIASLGGSGESGGDAPEKILIGISAAYSGGPVPAGTALEELTGVAVTAHYGDGSTADVTDYTLSGVIAEGGNTIVVSYGGMTATFQVVGTGSTVYLKDVAPYDQFIVRKNLTQNNEAGAWSVEVPYTEGMTVSGCMNPGWSYAIAIITAPDGTQSLSATDTAGAKLSEKLPSGYVTQYTAVLTGYAEGSTVRINMYMGKDITTEELARGFATTHRDYLYYEPGEV